MDVEIWSDVVCPWCYIGKHRFEQALARFPSAGAVSVTFRSFELDPTAPGSHPAGSHDEHLARKYGTTVEQARRMHDQMARTAAADGLELRFDRVRGGNTFDAHRLLHLGRERSGQLALADRLMRATFTDGEPISDRATLLRLAVEAGLDASEVRDVLDSDRYADAVRADEEQAAAYGITGVPFFVLDGRFGVGGAQPADVLLAALHRAFGGTSTSARAGVGPAAPSRDDGACAVG